MSGWLGEFEQTVLFAIMQLETAYGAAIQAEIARRTGRRVSAGAVYTTLERLEARGCLSSAWSDPTPERGGKRKRLYRLTAAGRAELAKSWRALQAMARGAVPKLSEP